MPGLFSWTTVRMVSLLSSLSGSTVWLRWRSKGDLGFAFGVSFYLICASLSKVEALHIACIFFLRSFDIRSNPIKSTILSASTFRSRSHEISCLGGVFQSRASADANSCLIAQSRVSAWKCIISFHSCKSLVSKKSKSCHMSFSLPTKHWPSAQNLLHHP